MSNYTGAKEISAQMEQALLTYMDMIGPRNSGLQSSYGFTPGLGLTQHKAVLQDYYNQLKEGVFQLMFTGCFSSGKSTMINALLRKPILRMAINPETAIITKIVFGAEEKAVIYLKKTDEQSGAIQKQEISLAEFFEMARVSQTNPEKFSHISYATVYLNQEGVGGSTVQFVDSPGTQNSAADSEAARSFIKKAHALVYLINAVTPFVQEDKEYIAKHFANKQMQNLFFVINRIDGVNEDEIESLKENVRNQLSQVFAREDGSFDEALFNRRVFYTNAYGSLQTRQNLPAARIMGHPIFLDDNETGVPQFENALAEFLTSGGRDKAAFQAYMPRLAGMRRVAEEEIEKSLARYREDADKLQGDLDKVKADKNKYLKILDAIRDSCKNTVRGILEDARREYISTVNRISAGWDMHFKEANVRFGFGQMTRMIGNKIVDIFNEEKAKESFKKLMKPFRDAVNEYVSVEMDKMEAAIEHSLQVRLADLEQNINYRVELLESLNMPLSVQDITSSLANAFHIDVATTDSGMKNNTNLFQVFASILALDPEMIGKSTTGGSTAKMIGELLVKNVMEFVAWYVVAWPIGIAMLVGRLVQIIREGRSVGGDSAEKMLHGMKDAVIRELTDNTDRYIMNLEGKLAVIMRAGSTMTDSIRGLVNDYQTQLENTIQEVEKSEFAATVEAKRTDEIRRQLSETLDSLSVTLFGRKLTPEELEHLAVIE